jgi:hypothetical protein
MPNAQNTPTPNTTATLDFQAAVAKAKDALSFLQDQAKDVQEEAVRQIIADTPEEDRSVVVEALLCLVPTNVPQATLVLGSTGIGAGVAWALEEGLLGGAGLGLGFGVLTLGILKGDRVVGDQVRDAARWSGEVVGGTAGGIFNFFQGLTGC